MAVNLKKYYGVYERIKNSRSCLQGSGLCFLCDSLLNNGERLLCTACAEDLPWNNHACPVCAIPTVDGVICAHCLQTLMQKVQHSFSAFRYEYPVNQMIHHMKFNSRLDIIDFFGKQIVKRVFQQGIRLPDCLIPVPLYSSRLASRGFNQSLELARVLARETGVPAENRACTRTHDTVAQTSLTAHRRKRNIKGAFAINRNFLGQHSHVTIIDDVVTTGSTVNELARVLSRAGVERIDVWACARAVIF